MAHLTAPLLPDDLTDGTLSRVVAGPPAAALLATLYGGNARIALELLVATDPVLTPALGGVKLVQASDWPRCPGAAWILAPFVRAPGPDNASRFSDGSFGLWYGADCAATAQAEVSHHLRLYLIRTAAIPGDLPRRVIKATPEAHRPLVDLRHLSYTPPGVLDPNSYVTSQPFGEACRAAEHWGIMWPSVRHPGGLCAGILRPTALAKASDGAPCTAHWDGRVVTWS